jgi:hypothetical protein
MLTRGHRAHPLDANRPMIRCSLGWALHGDVDVQRCQAIEIVSDCWKIHPERTPIVVLAPTAGADSRETEQKASAD